ncbi:MAG: hypothetical protein M3017_14520 [Actinomycetota bacterium]|nr:hypothetical protein [Actinomycetota bacterium]
MSTQSAAPLAREDAPAVLAPAAVGTLERRFIEFLQTGSIPGGLFAEDVFIDMTIPQWRLQATGPDGVLDVRRGGHPSPGLVPRWRTDTTARGFVIEVEETWTAEGQQWYCREMVRADVSDGVITELSVYCTGDWDAAQQARHRQEVTLLRP